MALSNAVIAGNTETVKLLLEYGAATDKKILKSPLLLYAKENKEMEALLKEHGFSTGKKDLAIYNLAQYNTKTKLYYDDGIFM